MKSLILIIRQLLCLEPLFIWVDVTFSIFDKKINCVSKCEFKVFQCPVVFISSSLYSAFEYHWMRFARLLRNVYHYFFLCQYAETGHKHRKGLSSESNRRTTELLRLEGTLEII